MNMGNIGKMVYFIHGFTKLENGVKLHGKIRVLAFTRENDGYSWLFIFLSLMKKLH